jgi:hypothetical protein
LKKHATNTKLLLDEFKSPVVALVVALLEQVKPNSVVDNLQFHFHHSPRAFTVTDLEFQLHSAENPEAPGVQANLCEDEKEPKILVHILQFTRAESRRAK